MKDPVTCPVSAAQAKFDIMTARAWSLGVCSSMDSSVASIVTVVMILAAIDLHLNR